MDADGAVQGGRISGKLRLDAAREDWTAGPVDLTATVEGPRAAHTLAALASGGFSPASGGGSGPSRKLLFRSAGVPARGLVSVVSLKGEGLALDYGGRIMLQAGGTAAATGTLRIAAAEAREALALGGLRFGAGMTGAPLEGDADLSLSGSVLTLQPKRLMLGGSAMAGMVKLESAEGKPVRIAASLDVDSASIPRLLAPIAAAEPASTEAPAPLPPPPIPARRTGPQPVTSPALASAVLTPGLWPEQSFDLSVLDGVEGDIEVRFKSLVLDEGLTLREARLAASLAPSAIKITALEGAALGGRLASRMTFEKAPAGVGLTGSLEIGGGEAAQAGTPPAAALALEFSGRALSPAALITALKGSGKLAVGDVTLSGVGPGPVAATAEAALQGKGPASGEPLVQALKAALKQGQVRLGAIEVPVVVGDGALKLERVAVDTEEGRASFETVLDLASMKVDSEWKIEAKVASRASDPAAPKVMLPPVSVVFTGKLAGIATAEPTLDMGALERELTVRKMERDVEELERLRKLDQDKAKAEQERIKALEAERSEKAAAAHSPASAADGEQPADAALPEQPGDAASTAATGTVDPAEAGAETDRSGLPAGRPVRRIRPPPQAPPKRPPAQTWKPFQITPY
jgi:hypothetical protein